MSPSSISRRTLLARIKKASSIMPPSTPRNQPLMGIKSTAPISIRAKTGPVDDPAWQAQQSEQEKMQAQQAQNQQEQQIQQKEQDRADSMHQIDMWGHYADAVGKLNQANQQVSQVGEQVQPFLKKTETVLKGLQGSRDKAFKQSLTFKAASIFESMANKMYPQFKANAEAMAKPINPDIYTKRQLPDGRTENVRTLAEANQLNPVSQLVDANHAQAAADGIDVNNDYAAYNQGQRGFTNVGSDGYMGRYLGNAAQEYYDNVNPFGAVTNQDVVDWQKRDAAHATAQGQARPWSWDYFSHGFDRWWDRNKLHARNTGNRMFGSTMETLAGIGGGPLQLAAGLDGIYSTAVDTPTAAEYQRIPKAGNNIDVLGGALNTAALASGGRGSMIPGAVAYTNVNDMISGAGSRPTPTDLGRAMTWAQETAPGAASGPALDTAQTPAPAVPDRSVEIQAALQDLSAALQRFMAGSNAQNFMMNPGMLPGVSPYFGGASPYMAAQPPSAGVSMLGR